MHAFIIQVATADSTEHTFPLVSLTESRQPHSIAQELINVRRADSPLNMHRYPIRDALRQAQDEWNVPLVPLQDGDMITLTDHKQGFHRFYVVQGFADKREPAKPDLMEATNSPFVSRGTQDFGYQIPRLGSYARNAKI